MVTTSVLWTLGGAAHGYYEANEREKRERWARWDHRSLMVLQGFSCKCVDCKLAGGRPYFRPDEKGRLNVCDSQFNYMEWGRKSEYYQNEHVQEMRERGTGCGCEFCRAAKLKDVKQ